MKNIEFERKGYLLTIQGDVKLTDGEKYFLEEDRLKGLVPIFYYREGFSNVFTFDLEKGYSLKDLHLRGEGLITLNVIIEIFERCLEMQDQYFLVLDHFVIHEDTILMNWEGNDMELMYAPPWNVPFLESLIELVYTFFKKERWFSAYVEGLNKYGKYLTMENYLGYLRIWGEKIYGEELEEEKEEEPVEKQPKASFFTWLLNALEEHKKKEILILVMVLLITSVLITLMA